MALLKKEQFEKLANFDNNPCVSIYIPTERVGRDVLKEKDKIQLKSQWKKVYEKFKNLGLSQDKIDKLGQPIEKILTDKDFWRHRSDGLAIFIADGFFEMHSVPVSFKANSYVSDHFYLKPLVPLLDGDGRFYLLSLQVFGVKLYEADRQHIKEIDTEELTPSRLEDRVGYDYEEKHLQHETQNSLMGTTVQQGMGGEERDKKNEYLRYFRAIDKGIHEILRDEKVPLVIACQDYLFPIYQEANTYKNLYPGCVVGNPSDFENKKELHAKTLNLLKPYFEKHKEETKTRFEELVPQKKSVDISEIIPAIYQGKVDTLFLQKNEEIWGNYNENMASVQVNKEPNTANVSLMNLAAAKVIEQGGKVYLVEKEFLPDNSSNVNAVFRY